MKTIEIFRWNSTRVGTQAVLKFYEFRHPRLVWITKQFEHQTTLMQLYYWGLILRRGVNPWQLERFDSFWVGGGGMKSKPTKGILNFYTNGYPSSNISAIRSIYYNVFFIRHIIIFYFAMNKSCSGCLFHVLLHNAIFSEVTRFRIMLLLCSDKIGSAGILRNLISFFVRSWGLRR